MSKLASIYPWDFRDITRRSYLGKHGIDMDSNYTDCLVEEACRTGVRELYLYIPRPTMQKPPSFEPYNWKWICR